MNYVLKRKDEIITIIDFADDGSVYKFHQKLVNPEEKVGPDQPGKYQTDA